VPLPAPVAVGVQLGAAPGAGGERRDGGRVGCRQQCTVRVRPGVVLVGLLALALNLRSALAG